jgi:hypothetical protein
MEKKLYMVETISIFRNRFVVEALQGSHASDEVVMRLNDGDQPLVEFSQHHIDECVSSVRELSASQFLEEFDKDNDYLSAWPISQKMNFINTIKYEDKQ